MASKFTELAIDCADPGSLARFWCSVLDYEVQDEDDGIVTIGSPMVPDGKNHLGPVPPRLTFAHVPENKDTCVKVRFKLTRGSLADAPTLARRATWSSRTHQMHPRNRASRTHQMGIRWCIPGSVRCGL
jgi:hypothetical protein